MVYKTFCCFLQVKAAYFAAGCLSEMSDDFAIVFLEMLRSTVSSQESSEDIKLAAGRAFAKLWCSFSIAENAYKVQHLPFSIRCISCSLCCDVDFFLSHI